MIPVTAAGLGINVSDSTGHGLYKWLLASFLIGKRIRSSFAVEEYRNLVDRHVDTIGEPTADFRSNIAAEARAKIVYERLMNVTDDPGVKEALGFLMTREIAHQLSFEKALHAIQPNFPQGKLPGMPEFTNKYFNMSGEPNVRGPWNEGEEWEYVENPSAAVDGGDGTASVELAAPDLAVLEAMKLGTRSDPASNPVTGADLGSGLVNGKDD